MEKKNSGITQRGKGDAMAAKNPARKKGKVFARATKWTKAKWALEKLNAENAAARMKLEDVHSKRALAAAAKVGKPFLPGPDPRRHKLGRLSLDRAAFSVQLNNYLCNGEGDPEELAKILWRYVRKGEPWAIKEILDRILGRSVQPIEVAETPKRITYVVKYADGPTVP